MLIFVRWNTRIINPYYINMNKIHILSIDFKSLICLMAAIPFATSPTQAQGVFTPRTYSYDPNYENLLWGVLTEESYVYYLCAPAFSNEYALILHGDTLVYIHSKDEKDYWFSDTNTFRDKLMRHQMLLSPA